MRKNSNIAFPYFPMKIFENSTDNSKLQKQYYLKGLTAKHKEDKKLSELYFIFVG